MGTIINAGMIFSGIWTPIKENTVGVAPVGASLDVDDVAGENNQDRGESRAPFLADNLPDGGGGGPARVVPGDSGKD